MKYHSIDIDYTPKVTGKRDGDVAVELRKNSFLDKKLGCRFKIFFKENYSDYNRIRINGFQEFTMGANEEIIFFPKTKSINELDFMSFGPYLHGIQFLISERTYEILQKYNLPIHNKIRVKINNFSQGYYLLGLPMLNLSDYDFNKSTFINSKGQQRQFANLDDFINSGYDGKTSNIQKLHLKKTLIYDAIATFKGVFFSVDIVAKFEEEHISGYKIMLGELYT